MKKKIIRLTTVPVSLKTLLKGQLNFIQEKYDVIAVSSYGKELKEVEDIEKVKVFSVKMSRSISPLKDIVSIFNLYVLFRKEEPFIVHSHTPKAGFVAMTAAFLAKIPNRIHTVAGLPLMESKGLKKYILLLVEKFTYNLATIILPNSFGLQEYILKNKLSPSKKLLVLGNGSSNGIDLVYFQSTGYTREQSLILKEKFCLNNFFVFLFIGRIVSHKGINELVNSFIEINVKYPRTKLLLVGDFENDLDPVSEETKFKLSNNSIIRAGYQSDVRPYLESADVFVFPSYREGFPNSVLQACAFNLPCIVSDINGCNEIISNMSNGILVPPKDQPKLTEAMKLLITNEQLRRHISKNNRIMVKEKFDQKIIWNSLIKLYDHL